jgi:SAM-dependent methyltransferase
VAPETTPRTNYDAVAANYDRDPLRSKPADPDVAAWLAEHPEVTVPWLLDVGSGTGNQIAANRAALPQARLVGVEPSAGMLVQARTKTSQAVWLQARAQELPLADGLFHVVTHQYALHHVTEPERFVAEAFRVLKPGGDLVITNIDPHSAQQWVLYRWFPEALAIDLHRFPIWETIAACLEQVGFREVRLERSWFNRALTVTGHLEWMRLRAASQLALLTDDQFAAGIAQMEREAAKDDGTLLPERSMSVKLSGRKPTAS